MTKEKITISVIEENGQLFSYIRNKFVEKTPEELVRQTYVIKLVNEYGYAKEQMKEEENLTGRGSAQPRGDIIIYKSKEELANEKNPLIIVECKAEYINISERDYLQGELYARMFNAPFFVTHNNKETRFWRVKKDKSPGYREPINNIPKATDTEKEIKKLLTELRAFEEDDFRKILEQCHDIIYRNDKLDPTAAFDEIAKILFMKVYAERNLKAGNGTNIFSFEWVEEAEKYTKDFIANTFEETKKEFGKGEIFKEDEKITLKKESVKQIIQKLQKYNLSATSADIKGIAFEKFLGNTFRSDNGMFFTPRTIVEFMIDMLSPEEGKIVCDPACGSGGFLIRYFQKVQDSILKSLDADYQKKKSEVEQNKKLKAKEKSEKILELFNDYEKSADILIKDTRLWTLANKCIFGADTNERMARTSKMNMIMHGDGHGGIKHQNGFINKNEIQDEQFDYIFTNPPFGSVVNDKEILKNFSLPENKAIKEEFLFIERCIRLLKEGGKLGIVLPESIFNNPSNNWIREFVEDNTYVKCVVSIPRETFLSSGADVKCSLLFIQKFTKREKVRWETILSESKEIIFNSQEVERQNLENILSQKFSAKEINAEKVNELKTEFDKRKKEAKQRLTELEKDVFVFGRKLAKEKFDYEVFMFEANYVGISAAGDLISKNDLPSGVIDFKNYLKNKKVENSNSRIVNFKKINRWDVKSYLHFIESPYELKKIKNYIYEHSEKIKLFNFPEDEFNILGVTNRGGVYLNLTEKGTEFNQAYKKVKTNEITYNPYRVNVGSIGIVPAEYNDNFISPAYVVFGVKEDLLPEYLYLVLSSDWFNPLLRAATTGSVRQNLTYQLLEELEIPFPDKVIQKSIVEHYNELQKRKLEVEIEINIFKEGIKKTVLK